MLLANFGMEFFNAGGKKIDPIISPERKYVNELHVAAELRGIRKSAAASRRWEVAAQTATGIRQTRVRSKLRGIDILNRVKISTH